MEKKMYCPFCGNPSVVDDNRELRETNRALLEQLDQARSIDQEWFNDATSTINELRQRAEAAEARAADAEVRAKSWHDSAMTLADQRDAAYKRNTELEAVLNDIKANTYMPDGTRLSDAVKQVMQERDELARKLEQAQRKIDALTTQLGTTPRHIQAALNDLVQHAIEQQLEPPA